MWEIKKYEEVWSEITDLSELSRLKTVKEMLPKDISENQRGMWRPKLTEEHFKTVEDCLRLDFTVKCLL